MALEQKPRRFFACVPCLLACGAFLLGGLGVGSLVRQRQRPPEPSVDAPTAVASGGLLGIDSPGTGPIPLASDASGWDASVLLPLLLLLAGLLLLGWLLWHLFTRSRGGEGQGARVEAPRVAPPPVPPGQLQARLDRPQGRRILLPVGTGGVGCAQQEIEEAPRARAAAEIGLVGPLELDTDTQAGFCNFVQRTLPGTPLVGLPPTDLTAGGTHGSLQERAKAWGPALEQFTDGLNRAVREAGLTPAEFSAIVGLGSQWPFGLEVLAQLVREYPQATFYVTLLVPDKDPSRSEFLDVCARYQALPYVRAILIADNACGQQLNDEALAVLQAARFSPTARGASAGLSGFNLLADISPATAGGLLTFRRIRRWVPVRHPALLPAAPPAAEAPTVDDADVLRAVVRGIEDVLSDPRTTALRVPATPVAGRAQLVAVYVPATDTQLERIAARVEATLRYDRPAPGQPSFYDRHPDTHVRFVRYDVPEHAEAPVYIVYAFAIADGLQALPAALARPLSSAPHPNGHATVPPAGPAYAAEVAGPSNGEARS